MSLPETDRRTKIVATVGPAISKPDMLRAVIEAGATTLRLNFPTAPMTIIYDPFV